MIPKLIKLDITEKDDSIYLKIKVGDNNIEALYDTGAQLSVIGGEGKALWDKFKHVSIHGYINVKTAGGEIHKSNGIKRLPIEYVNETRHIQVIMAPSIKIPFALGMNFHHAFNLRIYREVSDFMTNEEPEMRRVENDNTVEAEEQHELTNEQREKFEKVMEKFNYSCGDTIGCQKLLMHKLDTGDSPPIFSPSHNYNSVVTEKIAVILQRWTDLGIIEPSTSEWRSPIVVVKKPDGQVRVCLDATKLNAVTKRDAYMPPNVIHKLEQIPRRAKYFVRLDLNEAFLQTEMTPEELDRYPLTDTESQSYNKFDRHEDDSRRKRVRASE